MDYTVRGSPFNFTFSSPVGRLAAHPVNRFPTVCPIAPRGFRGPSPLDWERLRPIITKLYVHQDLQLKQLMELMQTTFHFSASEQMYKKRFAFWGLRKNYTKEQKAQIVEQLSRTRPQARPQGSEIRVNLRPLKLERIRKYMRQQQDPRSKMRRQRSRHGTAPRKDELELVLPEQVSKSSQDDATSNDALDTWQPTYSANEPRCMAVIYLQPSNHLNVFLNGVDQYFERYFSWNKAQQPYGYCKELADVFNIASSARRAILDNKDLESKALVLKALTNVESLIQRQPLQLIEEMFRRFLHPGWELTPGIRSNILKHIARETYRLLGIEHPLTAITSQLLSFSTMSDAAAATFRIISEVASKHLSRFDEDHFAVQQDIADCFTNIGYFGDAEIICQRSLAQAQHIFPPTHFILRDTKNTLGKVRYNQGDWKEAERLWREVYEHTVQDRGEPNLGSIGITTCECLASMYRTRGGDGDLKVSAVYYKLALQGALRAWGPQNVDVFAYFDDLAKVMQKAGDIDQLLQLNNDYAFLVKGREFEVIEGSKL